MDVGPPTLFGLAILCLASSGCLAPVDVDLPDGEFLHVWYQCGYVQSGTICSHWLLDGDGRLFMFQGRWEEGDGSIRFAEDARTHDVDAAAVQEGLLRLGLYRADRDYEVRTAYVGDATDHEMSSLREAAAAFRDTPAQHDQHQNLADAPTLVIEATTADWQHESRAYAGDGDEDFETLRDAFWDVRDRMETEYGFR